MAPAASARPWRRNWRVSWRAARRAPRTPIRAGCATTRRSTWPADGGEDDGHRGEDAEQPGLEPPRRTRASRRFVPAARCGRRPARIDGGHGFADRRRRGSAGAATARSDSSRATRLREWLVTQAARGCRCPRPHIANHADDQRAAPSAVDVGHFEGGPNAGALMPTLRTSAVHDRDRLRPVRVLRSNARPRTIGICISAK